MRNSISEEEKTTMLHTVSFFDDCKQGKKCWPGLPVVTGGNYIPSAATVFTQF